MFEFQVSILEFCALLQGIARFQKFLCPSPRALPDPGIEPESLASPALADGFFTTAPPGKSVDVKWFHRIKQMYFYPNGLYKYLLFDFSCELVIMSCCFSY